MMLTREEWRRYIEGRAKDEIPFLAYWHPQGFALMYTEPPDPTKPKLRAKKSTVAAMRKTMDKLHKKTWGTVTAEFDGEHLLFDEEA